MVIVWRRLLAANKRGLLPFALSLCILSACTTTGPANDTGRVESVSSQAEIDLAVPQVLQRLYRVAPGSRQLVAKSAGVLVFPDVVSGGLVVGAQYGRGALQQSGRTVAYYSLAGGSLGLQAGLQSRAIIYVFNSASALAEFRQGNGWGAGVAATVAAGSIGANGSVDSETSEKPVVSFVITNGGLEGGVSMRSFRISPLSF